MAIAVNYKGTTHRSTEWERHERFDRFMNLKAQLLELYSNEEIEEKGRDGFYFLINGDSEVLEFSIEKITV